MLSDGLVGNLELLEFVRRYEEFSNRQDFDLLVPFIHKDAVYWFSNGTYVGIEAIRKAFQETWGVIKEEKYTISDVEWLVVTDTEAVCIYRFHSDGIIDGKRNVFDGRGTNVFRKIDVEWKIIHEHLSRMV